MQIQRKGTMTKCNLTSRNENILVLNCPVFDSALVKITLDLHELLARIFRTNTQLTLMLYYYILIINLLVS